MNGLSFAGYQFDPDVAMRMGHKAIIIALILVVTWVVAKAVKWTLAKAVDRIPLLQRAAADGESIGAALGKILSLLVWLIGLIMVLQILGLNAVVSPLQRLFEAFMDFAPKIVGAGVFFFVGSMVAKIVRQLVETALGAVNFDKWANLGGAEAVTGNATISKTLGTIVYVVIIVPAAIGALDVLNIPAITVPAKAMLEMVLTAIPPIIGACLLLGLGLMIARWVAGITRELLPGLGFDRAVESLGVLPAGSTASGAVATLVQVAIMLFMGVAATRLLGFPELTAVVQTVLNQGGALVFGAVLIAVGTVLARILRNLVAAAAGAGLAPNLVYWLTVALFVFIGLKQMNIGGSIIDYAFTALVAGAAVAFALAFGLGGRDAAAKKLNDWTK